MKKPTFWNMVFILGRFRQLKLRFQFFTIGTNTFLYIWNLQWGFTALLHTRIWLHFRNNLVAILCCLPVLGKSGMLNLNFVFVFDTLYGCCQVFIIKKLDKIILICVIATSLTLLHHDAGWEDIITQPLVFICNK